MVLLFAEIINQSVTTLRRLVFRVKLNASYSPLVSV